MSEDRAVTPVVGKTLELGVVVLLIATLSTALYGGVVPDYRAAAGEQVGDRVLALAAGEVETAVPPNVTSATRGRRVRLPDTIRGATYVVRARGNATLVLEHPNGRVGGRTRLVFPPSVVRFDGAWRSDERAVVSAHRRRGRVVVHLGGG